MTTCFAHHHMTPAEYGFWQLCFDISHKTSLLYFDGRNMVKRFAGTKRNGLSKDYFYGLADTLTDKGWFLLLEPRRRNSAGRYTASKYRVLSHADWVAKHGVTTCKEAPDDISPVGIEAPTCRDRGTNLSVEGLSPVRLSRHNPMHQTNNPNPIEQSNDNPMGKACRDSGTGVILEGRTSPTGTSTSPACRDSKTGEIPNPDWDAIAAKYPN
jgi:hypothetical protein